jgi:ubiquinone/menaquinone biosynthesis C-methylase UbiE
LLEVGADIGHSIQNARRSGTFAVGLETEPGCLSRARDLFDEAHGITLKGKAPFAPVKGKTFDLVVLPNFLGNTEHPRETLREILPLLEDGGHLLLSLAWPSVAPMATLMDAKALLQEAGFEFLRTDINPRIAKSVSSALHLSELMNAPEDLSKTKTVSGRFTYEHIIRPAERLFASAAPETFADEMILVARKPPAKRKLSLTVGMLSLNEKESVSRMIDDIRAVAPDAHILLVDSSSDETPDIARQKGASVVRQLPPRGHGPAMETLMYEAAKVSDALIYLDCDFTYPASMIPRIRQLLEEGADVVNASRTSKYPKAMPIPNFIANRVFAATAQAIHGLPTTDVHSGMRGYRSSVIRAFGFDGEGDALPLDTLILPAKSNYNVIEFPIPYADRVGFSKLAKLRGTTWTFIRIATAIGQGKRVRSGNHYRVLDA